MTRFERMFAQGRKALGIYLMAGWPEPHLDEELALAALSGGADFLEIGFPFSDPIADGPVIQQAAVESLARGTTLASALALTERLRKKTSAPLVLMGYANPVHRMGYAAFAARAAQAGLDGVLVPDLPREEASPLREELAHGECALIPMAAPTTTEKRLEELVREGRGFLYLVSMTGLTGDRFDEKALWRSLAERARKLGNLPVCVGFGIGTADDAARAAAAADGVIVGTAALKKIRSALPGGRKAAVTDLARFAGELVEGLRRVPA